MSDDPPWLADAVEAAALAVEQALRRAGLYDSANMDHADAVDIGRAALAAFLRSAWHSWEEAENGLQATLDGETFDADHASGWHGLAVAIERLGAPEKPDAP